MQFIYVRICFADSQGFIKYCDNCVTIFSAKKYTNYHAYYII